MYRISLVIPIFNEDESLPDLLRRLEGVKELHEEEIIIVDDGSKDESLRILKEYLNSTKRLLRNFRLISLAVNQGQSIALSCGISKSKGKFVVMMDGDLQNFPEDVCTLVQKGEEGFQAVSGRRANRKENNAFRKFPSKVANKLLRSVTGCKVKDMGGMNCIQGDIARSLTIKKGFHRIIPALVHMRGGRTIEVPIQHDKRRAGVSKYTTFNRSVEVLFDIILLWFESTSKSRPIYVFGKLSVIFALFSFFVFCYLLFERQFYGIDMGTRPLFIIDVIVFLTSLGVLALGIVTELISDLALRIDQKREDNFVLAFDSSRG